MAVAYQHDPIARDEVSRHEQMVDGEATKLIRKGEGGDALGLYVSKERVTVAPNSDAMRAAMVADRHEAYERGADAVMSQAKPRCRAPERDRAGGPATGGKARHRGD